MIKGIGTDILSIKRFKTLYNTWGYRFLNKLFNEEEIPEYKSNKKLVESLAGKFAAKEAISKANGTGIGKDLSFKDIKILKGKKGKPVAKISKLELKKKIHISISHSDEFAVAFAIMENKWTILYLAK